MDAGPRSGALAPVLPLLPGWFRTPKGGGTLAQVCPPPVVLLPSSETARREQKPTVPGQRRKVPQALAHSQSLGRTPSGLPPWKLPPTLDNCPCGCLGCLSHEPSPGQRGWLRCRLVSLQCPVPAALPPWGPCPAGGRVAGHGRTPEYWEKASGLPLPQWIFQLCSSQWLCWNTGLATGQTPDLECSGDSITGCGSTLTRNICSSGA